MLFGFRTIVMILNTLHGQIETIENRLLRHITYRERLKALKKDLNRVIRGLTDLLDELGDNGID